MLSFIRESAILLLLDTSSLTNLTAFSREEDLSPHLISFKKELSFYTIIIIFLIIYSTIVKLMSSSSINSSSFTTSSSIVSTSINFILINNLIRITYYLYSFIIDISNITISREVIIIVDYIISKYSRFKIKFTRANVIELFFSIY